MKFTCFILMLFFGVSGFSQTFENGWAGMFSYSNIIEVIEGNDKFIAASDNALFIYDFTRRDMETFSSVNGLSGDLITTIYYSEDYDLIVIGYINGLIEIILEDDRVLKVVDILNKPTIPPSLRTLTTFSQMEKTSTYLQVMESLFSICPYSNSETHISLVTMGFRIMLMLQSFMTIIFMLRLTTKSNAHKSTIPT